MSKYDLHEELPDVPPVEETPEVPGQSSEEVKTETPEIKTPGQVSEPEETDTEKTNTESEETPEKDKTPETPKEVKKSSDQFTTKAAAIKAAENLSIALREDVDFDSMTVEQIKGWYDQNRPRLGKEGFKGNREQAKKLNQEIKDEDRLASIIDKKFDSFLEAQKPKPEPEKPKELIPPVKPEFDEEAYTELLTEDIRAAAKMLKEYNQAKDKYWEDRLVYEGALLGKGLAPNFVEVKEIKEQFQQLSRKEQEAEAERKNQQEWTEAENAVAKFVKTEGDDDFNSYGNAMNELAKENFEIYKAIAVKDGKERAIFRLYQDAKKEKTDSEKEKRISDLEAEIAALKSGKTLEEINSAKGAARITQTNGGVTPKTPQKPLSDQEMFEAQMRGNSKTRNKYEIDY